MAPPKREFGLRAAAPRWWLVLFALLGLSLYFYLGTGARRSEEAFTRFGGSTMGTTYSVLLGAAQPASERAALQAAVESLLSELNASMSTYDATSELSRFNQHRSTEPFTVSEPLAQVVGMAQEVSRASAGAFDITVGPLVDAWGFGPDGRVARAPSEEELTALRQRVGHTKLRLEGNQLTKGHPELRLDLSAIAKGYAVDRVAQLLTQRGHDRYLVEIGGELRAQGRNAEGQPFRVGVEEPASEQRRARLAIELEEGALATSGNYRNAFELDGQLYAHTLDPRTGRPVTHHLSSASVLHSECALADAWATALMAAGPEEGWQLAEKAELSVLLLVTGEGGEILERATPGFAQRQIPPGRVLPATTRSPHTAEEGSEP